MTATNPPSPNAGLALPAAKNWVASIFTGAGVSASAARSVAEALVTAEADGFKGHGLARIETYLDMVRSGKIDAKAQAKVSHPRPGTILVDAAHGFAYPAIDLAIENLTLAARQQGIAAAAITRSNHAGAIGLPVERLARAGFCALFFANSPAAMAPWGGNRPTFGTNPIAFAAPLEGRDPLVIDLALSKVARGNIVVARQKGESIPQGWALDRDGHPTTDAAAALDGTMIPAGDAKGAALAMMVEVLAACLPASLLSFEASSYLDAEGPPPGTGQFLIAIDTQGFGHGHFAARMTALAQSIEGQPGTRLSGQRRFSTRALAEANGLTIPPALSAKYPLP